MHTLYSDNRKSGISLIGELPWGSRFCQFYQTKKDLLEIFLPYLKAGLENNELCVWTTSRALGVEDAKRALKKAVPDFEKYVKNGQMEIIPSSRCHNTKGQGAKDKTGGRGEESGKVITAWLDKAISGGFEGLRLACSAFPSKEGGKPLTCFGSDAISKYNALAVFAYPRDKFDAIGLMEVVKNHRFALVKNAGKWEVLESSEARAVKDALRRSEEKLHSLFSNMSEGFAYHRTVLDASGKPCDYIFLEINEAFERLTGLKGKDIIGRRVTEALPGIEKDPTDWIGKYGKVALTGKPVQFESFAEPLKKWFSLSAFSPYKGYFAVTFTDITARKQAEQEIVRSQEEWERTFDSVPDMIAILDNKHRIMRVNRAMAAQLGLKPEECVGLPCYKYVHGLSAPPAFCPHSRTLKDGCEHMFELREERLGGDMLVSTTPILNDRGEITGSVHVARNISKLKQTENSLRESEQRMNRAEEIAHLGSWELDLASNHLFWSDEAYRIFGLKPQEFSATYGAFLEAVHPDDRAAVNEAYSGSLREGKDTYEIVHRVVRKATGEVRIVHEKCEHFRDEAGRIIRSVGMVHDITERKQAEEKLSQRTAELEAANRELEAFSYSVSHDLRSPLRSIAGFSQILLEDYDDRLDADGKDFLRRMHEATSRMSQLIDDLLNLSRIARTEMRREKVDLSELALKIADALMKTLPERKAEFIIAEGLFAYGDERLFNVMLENLLDNAYKFTEKQSKAVIEFGVTQYNGKAVYFVRDNGVGFDKNFTDKLFNPFQRLHTANEFPGTGIGLATVKRIIDRHGGDVWIEGEIDKGTTVYFTL
ncbi:MAG: PAS domain S-box protein [Nitrospirae bacterium]|nr:PAS domain S-box protein [Nitrospirota bacterium]